MVFDHELTTKLGDVRTRVDCKIHEDNAAHVHFFYLGKDYNFPLTRWKSAGFAKFRSLFHKVYDDIDKFGSSVVDPNTGDVVSSIGTSDQNKNIVKQAINDVFHSLNSILRQYPREILDYAVWFCEKHSFSSDTDYATYIQIVTCRVIVHSDFLAGNIDWRVVDLQFGSD